MKPVRTTIGDIIEEQVSQLGPKGRKEFTYVDIGSVDRTAKRIVEPKTLSIEKAPSRARQNLRAGDVLVSMTRPNLNAVAIVPQDLDGSVGSTGFHVLRARDAEPAWLFYAVQTNEFIDSMCRVVQGALYPAVRPKDIRSYGVLLPSLDDQRRITAEIEKQFTRLSAGVAALRRVEANLKRYRAAVLRAACEGRLVPTEAELARNERRSYESGGSLLERTVSVSRERASLAVRPAFSRLPDGWAFATLDRIAEVKGGITKDQKRRPSVPSRMVPYLRVANVQRGYIDLSEVKEILATEQEIRDLRLEKGDLLFNEGGDRDKLGRGWVWNQELPECVHQNHVFRARLRTNRISPKFISWYANTSGQKFFFDEGKHTTNLASISMTKLKSLPVPIPPPDEQRRIVLEVERRLSVIDNLEEVVTANLQRAARLRQSILDRAFTGRLGNALD